MDVKNWSCHVKTSSVLLVYTYVKSLLACHNYLETLKISYVRPDQFFFLFFSDKHKILLKAGKKNPIQILLQSDKVSLPHRKKKDQSYYKGVYL